MQFKCKNCKLLKQQFSSIWPTDRTLSSAATPGQCGPGNDGNEGVLRIPQSSCNTRTSPSDCLVSYPGHLLRASGGGGGLIPLQRCNRCILQPGAFYRERIRKLFVRIRNLLFNYFFYFSLLLYLVYSLGSLYTFVNFFPFLLDLFFVILILSFIFNRTVGSQFLILSSTHTCVCVCVCVCFPDPYTTCRM